MTFMGTFAQWEWTAAREKEQQVEAGHSFLARALRLGAQAGDPDEKRRPGTGMLKLVVTALGVLGK